MASILALLPSIIALIPSLTVGVEKIITLVMSIRAAAQQSQEWTPALEAAFLEALVATKTNPAYKQDAK